MLKEFGKTVTAFFTANLTRLFAFLLSVSLFAGSCLGLRPKGEIVLNPNSSLACVDALGRTVVSSAGSTSKQVGVFYFLWLGEHGTGGPYDNSKIAAEHPEALLSEDNWFASGGGGVGEFHFWGEPLFGYYQSKDTWVMRKHLQMLVDAGVDFIVFDTTNGYTYDNRVKDLLAIWYEYLLAGWDVPQIAFYTNSYSGGVMNAVYDKFYNNAALAAQYPRLDELWLQWDGKPMIVGKADDPVLRPEVKDYFRIKASQWPNEDRVADGFPWMEFGRSLTYRAVYGKGLRREVMSVSGAQHSASGRFSSTAWYGTNDRTRSWHDGANDKRADAEIYGFNFAEQWEFAMSFDPEVIFVTGFNEWTAQRQPPIPGEPIVFVDSADTVCSRDVEPMNGILGDNYYLQMVDYIAKFKSGAAKKQAAGDVSIDIDGGFAQWEDARVSSYRDFTNDTVNRNCAGFGGLRYVDTSGRNDIQTLKTAKDSRYLYFYADTVDELTPAKDAAWMNLLLSVDTQNPNLNGYDFLVNASRAGGKASVKRYDGSAFVDAGEADMAVEGNKIMFRVDRGILGLAGKKIDIRFKWADNCDIEDIYSFYTSGDCAPYGRLNFTFAE